MSHIFEIHGWFYARHGHYRYLYPLLQDLPANSSNHDIREAKLVQYKNRRMLVSITVKKRILYKKPNMINLLEEELIKYGIENWTVRSLKQRVEFGVQAVKITDPNIDNMPYFIEYIDNLKKHLLNCINEKWNIMIVFETNTLQALLMEKLKNTDFRVKAALYHAQNHGVEETLDLIDLIDRDWALRY